MRTPRGRTSRALSITAAGLAAGALVLGAAGCSGGDQEQAPAASSSASDGGGGGSADGPGIVGTSDGGGGDGDDGDSSSADKGEGAAAPSDIMAADANLRISEPAVDAEHAIDAATKKVGGDDTTVHEVGIEYDSKAKAWQWEVKILADGTDHEVTVDATDGSIQGDDKDSTDDDEKAIDLKDPMTYDDALDKASKVQDGPLDSWKLESDDGTVQYQFDIVDGDHDVEVSVDVETGDVTQDQD